MTPSVKVPAARMRAVEALCSSKLRYGGSTRYQMRAVPSTIETRPLRQPPTSAAMTTAMMPSANGATSPRSGEIARRTPTKKAVTPTPTASSVTGLGSRRDKSRGRSMVTSLRKLPPKSPRDCYHRKAAGCHWHRLD